MKIPPKKNPSEILTKDSFFFKKKIYSHEPREIWLYFITVCISNANREYEGGRRETGDGSGEGTKGGIEQTYTLSLSIWNRARYRCAIGPGWVEGKSGEFGDIYCTVQYLAFKAKKYRKRSFVLVSFLDSRVRLRYLRTLNHFLTSSYYLRKVE